MLYRQFGIITALFLAAALSAAADPTAGPVAAGPSGTRYATGITTPPKVEKLGKMRFSPSSSMLDDNGSYYRYQGKRVPLLRMKDRIGFIYRDNASSQKSTLKKNPRFRNVKFRQLWSGKRPLEVMSFDPTTSDAILKYGYDKAIDSLRGIAHNDPSVIFSTPVYFEPRSGEEVLLTDRISVKFADSADGPLRQTVASMLDAVLEKQLMPSVYIFKCNYRRDSDALQRSLLLEDVPGIEWVKPEMLVKTQKNFTPDDPLFIYQWHLNNTGRDSAFAGADMKVASAWDIQQMGDTGITIAVLDDGVDTIHPDLSIRAGGWDFCDNDDDPSPDIPSDMHGTAVAGVAAAIGNNTVGVAGVAAGSKILPIRMLEENLPMSDFDIADAITWAYEQGAHVLNNSWRYGAVSDPITTAIRNASTRGRDGKGCPVFFASGNDASRFSSYAISFDYDYPYIIAFVYQKDGAGTAGDDAVAIDNVVIYGSDGHTVLMAEPFAKGALPSGWETFGGNAGSSARNPAVAGWSRSETIYEGGFSDRSSFQSGEIGNNQWTELRMPMQNFRNGDRLVFHAALSTEEGSDSLKIRYYLSDGTTLYFETGVASGIAASESFIAFPASADSSIVVGASTDQDYRSAYSQYDVAGTGKTVDFLAPSGGGWNSITTTDRTGADGYSNGDYDFSFSGTSSACPAAAGLAALILSRNPHLTRNQVLERMRSSCDKIGGVTYTGGKHKEYGYGRLNALAALENLPPAITGQVPIVILRNTSTTLDVDQLTVFDAETPDGPFTLTVYSGDNYTASGTTVTPAAGFTGTLAILVSVNDGANESARDTLHIVVRTTNVVPVITAQGSLSVLEDKKLFLSTEDLSITDADDPSGPFILSIAPGGNYTVINDSIAPDSDYYGSLTVPVTVSDGLSSSAVFNVAITVTPVNDAPEFTAGTDISVNEDAGPFTRVSWPSAINAGAPNESGQSISFIITMTGSTLFSAAPSLTPDGTLTFTPASDAYGTATVTARLYDNGGTLNGGINQSAASVFTITILPANDAPVFTAGPDVTVTEDAGAQTIVSWATAIGPGATEESGQTLNFTAATGDASLFSVVPAVLPNGTLTFTPAVNMFGSTNVVVRLHDNGGTENGGIDSSIAAVVTITVEAINDAPSFSAGPNVTVNEDIGEQSLTSWATAISAGPNETAQPLYFTLTTAQTSLFSSLPVLSPAGDLQFTPASDVSGTATINARLHDSGGTGKGGIDSSSAASFTITISPVNDAPAFSPGIAVAVPEDAGLQTLPGWATISAGAPDETAQIVTITATATNSSLFTTQPSLSVNGTLSFMPAPDRYGSSSVTLMLSDNGGIDNGGVSTFTAEPFTITVQPVNDAPSFTAGPDITVDEDAGPLTIGNWAMAIDAGPQEAVQTLSFFIATTGNALFSELPSLNAEGSLSFTPAPNAHGSTSVSVRLVDNGGTAGGGIDSSTLHQFALTISPVNDTPLISLAGNVSFPVGSTSILTVTATDIDGTVPVIRSENLPSFAAFSSSPGSGQATITCSPQEATGIFSFKIVADDGSISVDSTITLTVTNLPKGAIEVVGAHDDARIALYATAGWIGKQTRTGPGKLSDLPDGPCLLSVAQSGFRTEYYFRTVRQNTVDTVNVSLRRSVPIGFSAGDSLRAQNVSLSAGSLVSVVVDDLDNDGDNDIVFIGTDGIVRMCKKTGDVFEQPLPVLSTFSGRNALRCVDWNEDGISDILTVNIDGTVRIFIGTGNLAFDHDSTLFSTTPGCTSLDLVPYGEDKRLSYLFGYSDGTLQYVYTTAGGTRTALSLRLANGQPLDVGDDASVAALDITGDDRPELLIGNSMGSVESFTPTAIDTVRSLGKCMAGGRPFAGTGGIFLSSTFGTAGTLPQIVFSDGNGALFLSGGRVRGDINDDGTVDVLDLQQLGIHWGQSESDAGWSWPANLYVGTANSDPQLINVLDLQTLGNFWGIKK